MLGTLLLWIDNPEFDSMYQLNELLNVPGFQFPHLKGRNNNIHLGVIGGLQQKIYFIGCYKTMI